MYYILWLWDWLLIYEVQWLKENIIFSADDYLLLNVCLLLDKKKEFISIMKLYHSWNWEWYSFMISVNSFFLLRRARTDYCNFKYKWFWLWHRLLHNNLQCSNIYYNFNNNLSYIKVMIINFLFITLKNFISMIFNNFIMIIIMIIVKINFNKFKILYLLILYLQLIFMIK